jgi:predicted secreted hydrolase
MRSSLVVAVAIATALESAPSPRSRWGGGGEAPDTIVAQPPAARVSERSAGGAAGGQGELASWATPTLEHRWQFPQDHWAKPDYRNEWWYFTGQLEDDAGARYGFQLTIFRIGLLRERPAIASTWATRGAVMGHAALSELATGTHRFSEVLWRDVPLLGGFGAFPDPVLAWAHAPAGTDGRWTVAWNGEAFDLAFEDRAQGLSLRLATRPEKPLAFQGPNGLSRKSAREGFASLYTSFTRLAATGTLSAGGRTRPVKGRAWMDRELSSSQLAPGQVGWDWFALQLADGRDLMLYVLRRADGGADFRSATLVAADGVTAWLGPDEWSVRATSRWRSPATRADYPHGWEVVVRGERLRVEPAFAGQENVSRLARLHYWEGAVRVVRPDGEPAGEGYVELTGYGERNRPPL